MKNFLRVTALAICAIFMVAYASAQVITAERASEIANQFFANGKQKSAAFRSTSATLTQSIDSRAIIGESSDAPTFHILTGANGKGFVIVSGEETESPIIGYSFDGTINTDEMSTGMIDYLTDIDAQVKALRKSNAVNPQKAATRSAMQKATATETGGTIVVELNTAQWAQGSPYNNYCFLEGATGTTKASTGCVPTAYSILCYYHKWPESAKEVTVYHANTNASMTLGHTYDYESMSNVSTEAGANAVATLMRDLGWAYQVSYGVGNTGTGNKGEGPGTLMDVFNYKSETPCNHGNYTSNRSTLGNDELWMQYIKESLDAGLPIPYSSTTSAAGTARHIYILDGYTNNNYFHFNWGWGGNGNGWFTLNNMVVDTSSDYSNSHKAYFKLMPNKTPRTVTATTNSSSMGTVSINGSTAGNSVSAEVTEGTKATLTAHPADGYALANWTKNGVVVGTKNPIQVTVGESGNDYVANFDDAANVQIEKTCTFQISDVTTSGVNGSYCSTWTTSDGIVLNCTKGSEPAYALSTSVNTFFAKAPVGNSETMVSDITYTLTAPEGYVIKSYSFKGASRDSSYTIDVTVGGKTTNVTKTDEGVTISASDINSRSTSFVLSSTYTGGRPGLSIMEDGVTVTIVSEGGGSTPTPEPEPEQPGDEETPLPEPEYQVPTGNTNAANYLTSAKTTGAIENVTYSANAHPNAALVKVPGTVRVGKGESFTLNLVAYSLGAGSTSTVREDMRYCHASLFTDFDCNGSFNAATQTWGNKPPQNNVYGNYDQVMNISATINVPANAPLGTSHVRMVYTNAWKDYPAGNAPVLDKGIVYDFVVEVVETVAITASASAGGTVSINNEATGTKSVVKGSEVTLTAEPNNLYGFVNWTKDGEVVSTDATYTFTAEENASYVANFKLHPDGAYKVYWQADNRGYLAYYSGRQDEAVLADVTLGTHGSNHYTSTTEGIDLVWYLITASDGKRYLFHAATGSFLCANPSVTSNGIVNKLSTTEAWPIAVEENTHSTRQGHYIITTMINGTKNLLCSGCGTSSFNGGHSVRWLVVNDANQKDGGAPLQLVKVDNVTVADNVMSAVRAVIEPRAFKFKAEIDGWRNDNPNTHLGTIAIGGTPIKLTPEHLTISELTMPLNEGTALAFTRKYRGFEFQGFYIGSTSLGTNPTLTADNVAAINETTPLVAKFTATDDVTLFYDDDQYSYRIPAIAKTGNGMLVAVTDYRHNHDDIGRDNHGTGTKRIDLVMRTSTDNGATWSETKTIAAGDNNQAGSWLRAFGDAAIATYRDSILVMAAAGDVVYTDGTTSSPNKMARIYSTDNGENWAKEEMTTKMYSQSTSLIPSGGSAFFGSGKLAVDENFNGTGKPRVYGALLVRIGTDGYNNFGIFSDDWGATWKILGGDNANPVAKGDEPKVEILPNGQILLSARRGGGRVFNVFTYGDDKANGAGTWSVNAQNAVNGCDNGGSNGTNGEIICLDAKKPNGKPTKILLQSQPKGGSNQYDRKNVTIWYKEVSVDETYTAASIASGWTQGIEVCPADIKSAYSAMCLQENGEIAFFFEEAPCHNDDHTYGYSMVYVPLTIEEITENNFLNPNAEVEYVPIEFNIELTDTEGNIYRETLDYIPDDVAAALTAKYPFITLGENGVTADNKYTNTVTLPFKVSNAETTAWYNIYWPANGNPAFNPIYMSASQATDTYVSKVTEGKAYGESSYNTLNNGDKIAWAIYSVNNTLTFKFKNKLTGNFIQVTGVATDSDNSGKVQNVKFVAEANATAFTLLTGGSYAGDYALKANVNGTDGYLCSTSASYDWATHYTGTGHPGAWVKFAEAPDYQAIVDALIADINNFGEGEGKYVADDAISDINKDALATMPINSLNTQKEAVQTVKDSYSEITLTVPVTNSGSVKIKNEAVSNKFVKKGEVTIEAVPAAGYYFVNWTKPAAQESAKARAAEARNAVDVVSTDNPYTFNLTDAVSLEANFEQIVVTATLTDSQGNQYIEQLDGFTNGVTKETIAAKLVEKHPYITLGTEATGITLEGGDGAYTYTNTVELPFKVTNTTYMWHNIYWPSNTKAYDYPVYWAASDANDTYVPKVTGSYAYGDHPTYNTKDGNNKISWAIYNVNNSFKFIFKNKVTGKYIQVTGVANGNAQNVVYVENAEDATAFTIEKKPAGNEYDTPAQYALAATVGETTGYLCSTSATGYNYATHYNSNTHQGAWVEFVESPDYFSMIMDLGTALGYFFGDGNGKCIIPGTDIEPIDAALKTSSGSITFNTLNAYAQTMEVAMATWPTIRLLIAPDESGTVTINNEEGVKSKRAPEGHKFPIAATPAVGYHFVNWTKGTDELSTNAEHTVTISGVKGEITNITANFAKNIYTINVSASEGGSAYIGTETSATVEHGDEVTLTAVANDGYEFVHWTKGTDVVSTEANYTFNAKDNGEYVANFREVVNCTVTVAAITVGGENGGTVKVAVGTTESNEALVVNKETEVTFTATAAGTNYRFAGWYNENDECVSTDATYSTTITTNTTYNAKFIKQVDVRIELIKNGYAFAYIGNEATNTHKVFDYGTTVDIHAVSYSADAIFAYWTLDGTKLSQDADYSFVAEEDSYYFVANFNYKAYIAVVAGDNGTAYIGSEGVTRFEMATGNTVTITAKAENGYAFDHWALMDGSSDEGTTVSTSAVYTLTLKANPNMTVTYKAFFRQITALEDGKAYRIAGKMSDGTLRYIYSVEDNRNGTNLKWSTTKDETDNSIFIAQSDFNGSLYLISAVGDYGWNYDGKLGTLYARLKADKNDNGTITLYAVSGTNNRSYTTYSSNPSATSDNINYYTNQTGGITKIVDDYGTTEFVFEEVPFAFNVSAADGSNAKLGTVNLPFATTVPEGVKVYGVDHTEGEQVYMKALELTNNVLPAKTPVLVEAEKAGQFGFAPAPASAAVHATGFAGTLEAKDIPGTTNAYILSYKGVGTHIMLYKLSSTSRKINANKAYYIDETGKASALQFVFGETTDIEEVEREDLEHTIYDLQGRKLSEITEPGIYIVNGKKVWVK